MNDIPPGQREFAPEVERRKRRRKNPSNVAELIANAKRATEARLKLSNGEPVSEHELIALFKSDVIHEVDLNTAIASLERAGVDMRLLDSLTSLYVEDRQIAMGFADIWCLNLDEEMLVYFRQHPDQLYNLHPRKFEELVAAIFRNNGFSVQLTPETRDGGVDIIAVQHSIYTGKSVNLIECKRYGPTRKVGIGIVQRLLGTVHQRGATKGIIVTTSFFSRDAVIAAESSKYRLALKDYHAVNGWLQSFHGRAGI